MYRDGLDDKRGGYIHMRRRIHTYEEEDTCIVMAWMHACARAHTQAHVHSHTNAYTYMCVCVRALIHT